MNNKPLADKIRPKSFDEIVGQKHLFGENGTAPTQSEIKLAQVAASFLGKQTEE